MTLDASDIQLIHDIANMRAHLRVTAPGTAHHEDVAAALARMEALWLNCGLEAMGLPLKPVPTAHPLPSPDLVRKTFAPGGEYRA